MGIRIAAGTAARPAAGAAAAALAGAALAAAALGAPAPAAAQDARACDRVLSHGGSIDTPRELVRRLRPGQVGCFRGGTYTSTTTVRRGDVVLRPYPGERVVWRARVVVAAPRVTIAGFVLDGTGRGHSLPSPTIHGPDAVVRGNDITNRTGICVHPVAYGGMTPHRFLVERNRIHGCGRRPSTNHDHGVYVGGGRGGIVRHNVIWRSADRGIQLYPFASGTRVYENTLDRNGMGIHFGADVSGNLAERNVVTRSRLRWNVEAFSLRGRGNVVRDNCLHATRRGFRDAGGLQPRLGTVLDLEPNVVAPLPYVSAARGDFRIAAGSPCLGRGAPADVADP